MQRHHHHHHHVIILTWCKRKALQERVAKSRLNSISRVLSMSTSSGEQISVHRSKEWWDGWRCCDEVWYIERSMPGRPSPSVTGTTSVDTELIMTNDRLRNVKWLKWGSIRLSPPLTSVLRHYLHLKPLHIRGLWPILDLAHVWKLPWLRLVITTFIKLTVL